MATETTETTAAPTKTAKGAAAPAGNRIKAPVGTRFRDYEAKRTAIIAANEGTTNDVLNNRANAAYDALSFIEGFSAAGAALGGFSDEEATLLGKVKASIDGDIAKLESDAELADLLG